MISVNDFEAKQMVFVFIQEGEKISFKNDNIIITNTEGKAIHQSTCYRLFLLFVCGDFCLTSGILQRAKKFGFSIVLMTATLRMIALLPFRAEGNVLLRKKQYAFNKTQIACHIIANKIHNQAILLKKQRNKTRKMQVSIQELLRLENEVEKEGLLAKQIMGIEGSAAKLYFSNLFQEHNWKARLPRTKIDMTNTLQDIGYTILFNIINALLEMYGFDVYVGVLHTQFFHRKSLVCDIEEPFRPIIDAVILKALNLKQVTQKDFWISQGQFILPWKNSKKFVSLVLEGLMEYKREIFLYVQSYYRAFVQEKNIKDFPVFYIKE